MEDPFIGRTFGRWLVVRELADGEFGKYAKPRDYGKFLSRYYLCICAGTFEQPHEPRERAVLLYRLVNDLSKSCGCIGWKEPVQISEKRCTSCNLVKEISAFVLIKGRGKYQPSCKQCKNEEREKWHQANKEYERAKHKATRARLKYETLCKYSSDPPCCACCQEKELEFLALDHIDGGGNAHRLSVVGDKRRAGVVFFRWLKKNGFPSGFRVLCHNCNYAFYKADTCPHKEPEPEHLLNDRRLEALKHYSGDALVCACCGVGNSRF